LIKSQLLTLERGPNHREKDLCNILCVVSGVFPGHCTPKDKKGASTFAFTSD